MRALLFAAALAVSAIGLVPAAAQADTADDFNLFVIGEMRGMNSATDGRVAVGGKATLTNYQVGGAVAGGQTNLAVGGNLQAQSLNVNGQSVVGGTASTLWGSPNVQAPGTALGVDFATEALRLKTLSLGLADMDANGATIYALPSWASNGQHQRTITLTGGQAGLNVFDLDAAMLADASAFTINLAPGSTALINVSGVNGKYFQTNFSITGGNASSLLWNFSEASNLSFYNTGNGFQGSVLAPLATYNPAGWGDIYGQVYVNNFYSDGGSTRIHATTFAGDLLAPKVIPSAPGGGAVPEPAAWALMITGFGLMGSVLRRRRLALARIG